MTDTPKQILILKSPDFPSEHWENILKGRKISFETRSLESGHSFTPNGNRTALVVVFTDELSDDTLRKLSRQLDRLMMDSFFMHSGEPSGGRNLPVMVRLSDAAFIELVQLKLENRELQSAIQREKQTTRDVLRCIFDAVVFLDPDGRVEYMNLQAEQLLLTSFEKAKGRPFSQLYKITTEKGEVTACWETAARHKEPATSGSNIFLKQSWLTRLPVEDTAAPMFDAKGNLASIIVIFRDISEQVRKQEQLLASEEKLRTLVENAPDNIFLINRRGEIQYINHPILGYRKNDMMGRRIQSFFEPDQEQRINETIKEVFEKKALGMFESSIMRSNNDRIWYSSRIMPILKNNRVINALAMMRNTTDRKKTEEDLRQSRERFALAAEGSNDGLWDYDIIDERVFYSRRWKEMLGFGEDEIKPSIHEWFDRVHPEDKDRLLYELDLHMQNKRENFRCEYRLMHKNGDYLWMLCRGIAQRDRKGRAFRIAGSQADITKRKLYEQQLVHDAFHDGLTSLPNRNLFIDHLEGAINRYKRNRNLMFAVFFLDLDRFKIINDSLGHLAGDRLLKEIAIRLQNNLRKGDTVARFGGDEFTVLLEGISREEDIMKLAEKIQNDISRPIDLGEGHEVVTSVSIGIATSSGEYDSPEKLMRDADTAMYRAKSSGKGTHVMFNITMHKNARREFRLEREMRNALDKNEFVLYYQPIIGSADGRIIGFESLIRWNHPRRGLVGPDRFIPHAEETGRILQIGEWVLGEAARTRAAWLKKGLDDFYVSVNLSALRFYERNIDTLLKSVLDKHRLPAHLLELEITESKLMTDADSTVEVLHKVKQLGISLAVDDFGTGYSSMSYLKRFPIQRLKIDRSFVKDIMEDENDASIVKAIIALAHTLGLQVVAEGVETEDQLDFLKSVNCNALQGFYFSKAVPAAEAEKLLKKANHLPAR